MVSVVAEIQTKRPLVADLGGARTNDRVEASGGGFCALSCLRPQDCPFCP